jgi:hypothetical protein
MLKEKIHMCKKIARKKLTKNHLWPLEWSNMKHIFLSPYHNHFWVDLNIFFFNMYIKELFRMFYFRIGFLVH